MQSVLNAISLWILPTIVAIILLAGLARRVPVYTVFVEGAKDGFGTAVKLIPHLVAMMVAVAVFQASGAMGLVVKALAPLLHALHIPPEIAPLGFLRPISGNGSLAVMTQIFKQHGPDSALGLIASTVQASTDTTLYIITVYFGSIGIQNVRYALKVGLLADFISVVASIFAVHLLLGTRF